MPYQKVQFGPGFDKQNTEITSKGKWIDGDKVRFRYGYPEKIGGWEKVSETTFIGVARAQLAWNSLDGTAYDMFGTHKKLYVYSEGNFFDATPTRLNADITSCFTTSSGSSIFTVTHSSHGASEGDYVTLSSTSATIGGVAASTVNGEYEIISVPTLNTYTIDIGTNASSSVSTTGNCTVQYEITSGRDRALSGYGWGTGTWNSGQTWDSPNTSASVTIALRSWALDNWGEDLLALDVDGGLFICKSCNSFGVRALTFTLSKKASILIALPIESKQYLVVFLQLKYGKFRKFPVSSCDFNSICFGNTSALPNPSIALIDISLSRISFAGTKSVVNKNICAPPLLDLQTDSGIAN